MRAIALALAFAVLATPAQSEPIAAGAVDVVDADTIRVRGQTVRLVGFDTQRPASTLAAKASAILQPALHRDSGHSWRAAGLICNSSAAHASRERKARNVATGARAGRSKRAVETLGRS
jgi:hypothetical protein